MLFPACKNIADDPKPIFNRGLEVTGSTNIQNLTKPK
jgi:hypothetical protein